MPKRDAAAPGDTPSTPTGADLLALAVHEFRTPLSVLTGYLRMLSQEVDPPYSPRQAKMIAEADKSCARIGELVAELNELSKLDLGTAMLHAEEFDLFRALSDAAAGVREGADRDVVLQVRGESSGAPVRGDQARIRQALATFLRTALREQPSAATVVVDHRLETISATIVIAEERTAESAYSAPRSALDERRGGLGLTIPIARRVIEYHGGRAWSAGPPGPGAAIIISLPLTRRDAVTE
jgi:two-component system cell cycle sensor histidine kinase PleC